MRLAIYALFLLMLGCKEKHQYAMYYFEQLDSVGVEIQSINTEGEVRVRFHPLYLGEDKDSIYYYAIGSMDFRKEILDNFNLYIEGENKSCSNNGFSDSLNLYVDTQQVIGHYGLVPYPIPPHPDSTLESNQLINDSIITNLKATNCYPVIIKNPTSRCLMIGNREDVSISVEILKDSSWMKLSSPVLQCGHSSILFIPSNGICVTSFPIYENLKGKYLRLELNGKHSNVFYYGKSQNLTSPSTP